MFICFHTLSCFSPCWHHKVLGNLMMENHFLYVTWNSQSLSKYLLSPIWRNTVQSSKYCNCWPRYWISVNTQSSMFQKDCIYRKSHLTFYSFKCWNYFDFFSILWALYAGLPLTCWSCEVQKAKQMQESNYAFWCAETEIWDLPHELEWDEYEIRDTESTKQCWKQNVAKKRMNMRKKKSRNAGGTPKKNEKRKWWN